MLVGVIGYSHESVFDYLRRDLPPNVELVSAPTIDELKELAQVEGIIGFSNRTPYPTESEAPNLRWLHFRNAGVERLPPELLNSTQWQITHMSGPAAVPIAEWIIGVMIHFAHQFPCLLEAQRRRAWPWPELRELPFAALRGATVGILGYGAIGRETARLCKAFGMSVHASLDFHGKPQHPTYLTPGTGDPDGAIPDDWYEYDDLERELPQWDYIVLGLRVTDETRHIINARTLACCKPTAVLINPARGALVDETALIEALGAGRLGGAALDVFEHEPLTTDHPLRDAPNVFLSPHCAGRSDLLYDQMNACTKENLHRFAAGEPLLNVVVSPVNGAALPAPAPSV